MKLKDLIRWVFYGAVVIGGLYAVSYLFKSCKTEYTEPEVLQTEQT